jgi:nudix-type nucleoside diphosphatase (YffH/AdpP family)
MKVEILHENQLFKGFFNLFKTTLRFEKFNGDMSEPVVRVNVYRGDAVAVLVYDSKKRQCILVRQFRYPIYTVEPENAWTLEAVAGSIEHGASVLETAVREIEEEVGYRVEEKQLVYAGRCYPSPGGTSERIYLYAVDVAGIDPANSGGGLEHEAEDIQVVKMSFQEFFARIDKGEICDAKTLLLANWLRARV